MFIFNIYWNPSTLISERDGSFVVTAGADGHHKLQDSYEDTERWEHSFMLN